MYTANTLEEFIDLVHDAIYDLDELRLCVDDSDLEEDWERYSPVFDRIDADLRRLYEDLLSGKRRPGDGAALAFEPLLAALGPEVPLKGLLGAVAEIYRRGI